MKFKDAKCWSTLSDPRDPVLFTDEEVIAIVGSLLYNSDFKRLVLEFKKSLDRDPEIFENFELWGEFIEDVADVDLDGLRYIILEHEDGSCVVFYRDWKNPWDYWMIAAGAGDN